MKEAEYISKTDLGDPELEFENLRKTGIEEIQRLAGNQWTDYNVHDPGITILEQLCFAITELGYKTAFDIEDLLASQNVNPATADTFFPAAEILEGKPITIRDFRKLLIDRVDGLRDVWIEPLNLNSGREQIKGMYLVLIKRSPVRIKTDEERETLLKETRSYLEKYSNLGEAFNDILILDEVEIKVSGKIDLLKETNVDKTHAQILYNIQQFISSPIRFYSLEQMQNEGFTVEEIFSGPRLRNGFIKDADLKDRIKTLMTSHLISIINAVDGVSKVRFLKIETIKKKDGHQTSVVDHLHLNEVALNSETVMDEGVLIDLNKVAVLAKMMIPYNPEAQNTLAYYQNNEKANLFNNNVVRYFRQIENENKVKYNSDFQPSNDIAIRKGFYKPIEEYYSVQEHFPAIYALGRQGIPPSVDEARVNKIRQLKAYLLIFEQILSNYLAQLTHFSNLFSLDEALAESYFAGSLETVPYIRDLLVDLSTDSGDTETAQLSKKISQSALDTIDDFYRRRHQVLDHLLARFGEKLSSFAIEKYNYYYDEDTLQKVKISAKIQYLKELIYLSSNKARSFNAESEFWAGDPEKEAADTLNLNISYLEKKARIRLGMKIQNIRIADYHIKNIGSGRLDDIFPTADLAGQLTTDNRLSDTQLVLNTIADPQLAKETFNPGIPIDTELLRRGIWADNYKLITDSDKPEVNLVAFSRKLDPKLLTETELDALRKKLSSLGRNQPAFLRFWINGNTEKSFLVEFEKEDSGNYNPVPRNVWAILNSFDNRNEARAYIQSMTNYLAYLNINMEGFYLVDHIELRPRSKHDLYGIILKDRLNRTGLVSAKQYSYVEVQEAFINLVLDAREATFRHEKLKSGEIHTSLLYNGAIIGTYMNLDPGQTLDKDIRVSDLKTLFDSLTEFDLHDPSVIQLYSAKKISRGIGKATFFSFRLSIIIPSWPSRFSDPEFRKILEAMIREDAPAHIGIDFHYLDVETLNRFETCYSQWLDDLRQVSGENTAQLNASAESLSLFIKHLKYSEPADDPAAVEMY